jgi:hypothetical protein
MTKLSARRDRFFLRDLHQEIDFYDRKLDYLNKFLEFATPADREESKNRLLAKRAPLEKAAVELAASGIEFDEKQLPRSFRTLAPVQIPESKGIRLVR